MVGEQIAASFEPELLWRWAAARSLARGQPLPVPDHGGMRIDTALPEEAQRYVFAGFVPGLLALAETIHTPRVFLKVCAAAADLRPLLPPRWQFQPAGFFMAHEGQPTPRPAPVPGYDIECLRDGPLMAARIRTADGAIAASGHAVEHDGVFILDRILTDPAHRRRGLGRALVMALISMQRTITARRVLIATDEGRALYETMGWRVLSPYSTLVIPYETNDIPDCIDTRI